jgi:hypothetical protein
MPFKCNLYRYNVVNLRAAESFGQDWWGAVQLESSLTP